jgi:multidrug transporter EmrE-like cation transporter
MINVSQISYGFAMSILDIIMETLCKYYSVTVWTGWMRTSLLLVAMAVYAFQPLLFTRALKQQGMAVTNVTWNVVSTGLIVIIGAVVFGERLDKYKWLGILLSIISLMLLSIA